MSEHVDSSQEVTTAAELWFAVQVKPRHEKAVSEALRTKGYEEFLPLYTVRSRWSDRYKNIQQPLFPRYTFCRFNPNRRLPILQTPGVTSIVGFSNGPVEVNQEELLAIQAIVQSGLPAAPHGAIEIGHQVRLCAGPLSGLQGVLKSYRESDRLIVAVTLLQRSVAVEISRDWVEPL